jgi:serine acetyltransferase
MKRDQRDGARVRAEGAARYCLAFLRDAELIVQKATTNGSTSPVLAALVDPSLWALALLRGASALRASVGTSLGLSLLLRVGFHIDVWTDDIGPGLRLPHPFNIVIGSGVSLGPGCTVLHGVTVQAGGDTAIARDVVLCTNAVVLSGAWVGEGVIVGAASVVRGIIPEHCVAAGAPARVIRRLSPQEAA